MSDDRRQPAAQADDAGYLSHAVLYSLIGLGLGAGSPLGAFLMRFWRADPLLKHLWVHSELSYNSDFYWYMGLGTVSAFVGFGWWIGRRSDRQRVRNKALRRRVDELHVSSVTDGLTGAFSHAYLRENLQLEMERSHRQQTPLSVLMLDLDDFKKINDTHGHLFGDRVLQEVTETISMNIRQGDVLGRYGGEEFLVLMPGADAETAKRVAERVRQAVATWEVFDSGGQAPAPGGVPERRVRPTLSIGVGTYTGRGGEDAVGLIDRADKNLYRAKREGKNRVCEAPQA